MLTLKVTLYLVYLLQYTAGCSKSDYHRSRANCLISYKRVLLSPFQVI